MSLSDVLNASKPAEMYVNLNSQEADGQDLIDSRLPVGLWTKTEDFCHANAVYGPL